MSPNPLLAKWFPNFGNKISSPVARVFCFHGAGSDSTTFTSRGGPRKMTNVLSDFCSQENIDILACHLPGRTMRYKDPLIQDIEETADIVFNAVRPLIADGKPYVIVGHSMGCIISYELLRRISEAKLNAPHSVHYASGLPCTGDPIPFNLTENMNGEEFKDECRAWSCSDEVFSPAVWEIFEPVLRSDLLMFEKFHRKSDKIIGPSKLFLSAASEDNRGTPEMISRWNGIFNPKSRGDVKVIEGNHNFVSSSEARETWMSQIIRDLESLLLDLEYA